MSNFTIVLPCLNEIDNLRLLIPELQKLGCEIVVCDNGSTDGSVEYLEVREVMVSQGRGTVVDAILRGISLASNEKVLVMDSDLSHPPATVPLLVFALDTCDLVVASRYTQGGRSGDSLRNRIISKGFNLLSWGLAPGISDRASGFWGVKKSVIKYASIRNTTKPALEYVVRGKIAGVGEVPYEFRQRASGEAKLGKPILKELWNLLLLYIYKYQRPLKFCLVGGTGALLQLGFLTLFTEAFGWWYVISAITAICIVTIYNYSLNSVWTFGTTNVELPDYEWKAWYRGSLPQKWWKRDIGKKVAKMSQGATLTLSLGCGSSPSINLLPGKVIGVDNSSDKLSFLSRRTKAELVLCDLDKGLGSLGIREGVDNVVCTNVLEHLENPEGVFRDSYEVLQPNGTLIVTVPDYDHPLTSLVETLSRKVVGGHMKDHKCKLSESQLVIMGRRCGFRHEGGCLSLTDRVMKFRKNGTGKEV